MRSWISGRRGNHEAKVTPLTKKTKPMAMRADRERPTLGSVAWWVMAAVTIYHNPRCTKSRQAMAVADELGVEVDVVRYLDDPPDAATLRTIVDKLDGPVDRLVRRDRWDELGVTENDVATADAVVEVLARHPQLLERPLLVTRDRAVIGRPTERARDVLAAVDR